MNTPLAEALRGHLDTLLEHHDERLKEHVDNFYTRLPAEQRVAAARDSFNAIIEELAGTGNVEEYYHDIALKRARHPEYNITSFRQAHRTVYETLTAILPEIYAKTTPQYDQALRQLSELLLRSSAAFYEAYTQERESALREREAELEASAEEQEKLVSILRELSSPIVPVHDSILVLPLVGAIDTSRAQTITEDLLEAIVERQADLVLIDITGVPVVDTAIANYLLQTTKAVNLLGAQVILVGISAEVAQTIVGLDLDLNRLTVRANLQDGIDFALSQLGLQITAIQTTAKARG